ncbi:MAG: DUF4835 family protein [Ferruginibacter sp.]
MILGSIMILFQLWRRSLFSKAQNIVNNALDGRNISGWKAFDGIRNRYWLVENMLTAGTPLCMMYIIIITATAWINYTMMKITQAEIMNVLNLLNNFTTENPNKMINHFFSCVNQPSL